MGRPYVAGYESREYYRLPAPAREGVDLEADKRFRKETGVTRQLNPTSAADLELRRTWLRFRDDVINERLAKEEVDLREEQDLDALTGIPDEMRWHHWDEGAVLLETWFGRPPAIVPKYSVPPVTSVIKMDWVLSFPRAKSVYDGMLTGKIWTNNASRDRMALVLKPSTSGVQQFGDLSQTPPKIDDQWINSRPLVNGSNADGLTAALGSFTFQLVVAGKIQSTGATEFSVTVEEVGIYVKDSFDFNGDQFLGVWGIHDSGVNNSDFRDWRAKNNAGGDFQVFSDIKRTKLSSPDVVKVT